MTLMEYREKFDSLRFRRDQLSKELEELKLKESVLRERTIAIEKVKAYIQFKAEEAQRFLEVHISRLVSTALSAVFDDPEEFLVKFIQKNGRTACELSFMKNGREMDPIGFTGGGVLDITCFALRVAFLRLKKTRNVLILDEPFRNLHGKKEQERCSEMVKMLCRELGMQILMVSDVEEVNSAADKIFYCKLVDGTTQVQMQ